MNLCRLTALMLAFSSIPLTACLTPAPNGTTSTITTNPAPSPTAVLPDGPKAVKIIFKQDPDLGSFDSAPSNGTKTARGSGFHASRFFKPDGKTLLSSRPSWLVDFEIGLSGSQNEKANNSACARFATNVEIANSTCSYAAGVPGVKCGASGAYYRVSEWDCAQNTNPVSGNGTTDGVYIRAYFSRLPENLAATENILAVVEYTSSAFNLPNADPATCFNGGDFTGQNCADFIWHAYLRPNDDNHVQPFMLFVPPMNGFVNPTLGTGGGGTTTRQIMLPLAANPDAKIFQLSRITSSAKLQTDAANPGSDFSKECSTSGVGNSPLCAGMVFYSITFYRM